MSHSLYNPFMPSRFLNPRASGLIVFGGGAEAGYAEGGNVGSEYRDTINRDRANDLSVKKQTLREAQELLANEQAQTAKVIAEGGVANNSGTDAAQKKVDAAQKKVNTAAGDLAIRMENQATKKSISALTDPESIIEKATTDKIDPDTIGTSIAADAGKATGTAEQMAVPLSGSEEITKGGDRPPAAAQASGPDDVTASTYAATQTLADSKRELGNVNAAQGNVSKDSIAKAATMDPLTSDIMDLDAAQGKAIKVDSPEQRKIEAGEIISGVADAETAAAFTEKIQAATATPSDKATVQGQLAGLMDDFEGGETPPWAAGAMRAATAAMAARGLSSSSMAGQAIIQATMESALPIAMADAKTVAQFESQNLSNNQQRAMLAAQQRATFMGQEFDQAFQARVQNASKISDVANMNFTAEQQIALENSRAANTMELSNLSNRQGLVMAQASAISQLDQQNLSNVQQAAVQKANAFLQMDMTNLSNRQQTELFKAQAIQQSILTDAGADNAAKQFNSTSENQTNQFMESLSTQVSQFNTSQTNAMTQFREGEKNAANKFNASMREQRVQFNASNALVIAQANAVWRQNTETINTAAQNQNNMDFAKNVNGLTNKTLDEIYQRERDMMDMYFNSQEKKKDRITSLLLGDKDVEAAKLAVEYQEGKDRSEFLFDMFWPF
tara:strand:- start:2651 stop:4672 length:2022 start_codon:yes stop_codon:yes gene_type:complete